MEKLQNSDTKIIVGDGKNIYAYSQILMQKSQYFNNALSESWRVKEFINTFSLADEMFNDYTFALAHAKQSAAAAQKARISSQIIHKSPRTYLTANSCRPGSCLTLVFIASLSLRLSPPPQSTFTNVSNTDYEDEFFKGGR
ncbi:4536_t:CDS:2 [Dentiscutata heterogama]|uniref:4536_t:CDS:1 n=1 Tax=Dentiscutata heterogama TaxID=1316150 RepID=A0ACA9LH16_9GLOM|nr:4536_t:CDS:2 [Dentiscutata heterogama]